MSFLAGVLFAASAAPPLPDWDPKMRQLLAQVGSCFVEFDRSGVERWFQADTLSPDNVQIPQRIMARHRRCMPDRKKFGFVGFSTEFLKGAAAEAYLKTKPELIELLRRMPDTSVQAYESASNPVVSMHRVASCVVQASPGNAVRLLDTTPLSPEEGQAVARLVDTIERCEVAGRAYELVIGDIRGKMALALNRLASEGGQQLERPDA